MAWSGIDSLPRQGDRPDERRHASFTRMMRVKYVVALSLIGLLAVGGYLVAEAMIGYQGGAAKEIRLSTRQPMLVQRAALLAYRLAGRPQEEGREAERDALSRLTVRIRANHAALTGGAQDGGRAGGALSPMRRAAYFGDPVTEEGGIDAALRRYLLRLDRLAGGTPLDPGQRERMLAALLADTGPLVNRLEAVSALHESEADLRIDRLIQMQRGLLGLMIAALVLVGAFIFRPMERSIARAADRLREVFSVMSQGVLVIDQRGRVTFHNDRLAALLEMPPDWTPRGLTIADFVRGFAERGDYGPRLSPEEAGRPDRYLSRDFRGIYHETPSGRTIAVAIAESRRGGHVLSFTDMTTQKESARALARAERAAAKNAARARELAIVAERTNDLILLLDAAGRITWVNRAFARATGFALEDAAGAPFSLQFGPETEACLAARFEMALAGGGEWNCEARLYRKDGSAYWADLTLSAVGEEDATRTRFILAQRDSSRAHEMRERLAASESRARELADRAQAANRAKSVFLANMSHEIRTPMNGIIGMAELLCETALSADQRSYGETIRHSGEALLVIINDILDFSKIEAGKITLHPAPFDLCATLEEVVTLIGATAREKGIAARLDYPDGLPRGFEGDAGRVRQIVMNLVGNAVKFTESGHVAVSVNATVEAGRAQVEIAVSDTGIGIPADVLPRIFDDFAQGDERTARRFHGTGLGLAITRWLVRLMEGDIGVDSVEGQGTTFTLRLPLPLATAPRRRRALGPDERAGALEGLRVLLAEDNRTNRLVISKLLGTTGCQLAIAEDGEQAVAAWRETRPDIVLMDLSMPLLDGYAATRAIREAEAREGAPRVAILALTANAMEGDRERCLAAGMDDHVPKPVRKETLLAALSAHSPGPARADAGTLAPGPK